MIGTAIGTAAVTPNWISARGWMGVTQAAKALGYDRRTVRKMIEKGELAAHRIGNGGDYRISKALIEQMVKVSVGAVKAEIVKPPRVIRRESK